MPVKLHPWRHKKHSGLPYGTHFRYVITNAIRRVPAEPGFSLYSSWCGLLAFSPPGHAFSHRVLGEIWSRDPPCLDRESQAEAERKLLTGKVGSFAAFSPLPPYLCTLIANMPTGKKKLY